MACGYLFVHLCRQFCGASYDKNRVVESQSMPILDRMAAMAPPTFIGQKPDQARGMGISQGQGAFRIGARC